MIKPDKVVETPGIYSQLVRSIGNNLGFVTVFNRASVGLSPQPAGPVLTQAVHVRTGLNHAVSRELVSEPFSGVGNAVHRCRE